MSLLSLSSIIFLTATLSSHLDPSHYVWVCVFFSLSLSPHRHSTCTCSHRQTPAHVSASAFTLFFLSPSLPFPLISLWMACSFERFPLAKPLLSPSMWPCFKRNPWCGVGEKQRYVEIPSLKVCVRSGRKSVRRSRFINHQHILGFEDLIQSLLSLCLWLSLAVSNTWHHQTLLGLQFFFYKNFLYPCFTSLNLHLTV